MWSVRFEAGRESFWAISWTEWRPESRKLKFEAAHSVAMHLYSRACQASSSGSRCSIIILRFRVDIVGCGVLLRRVECVNG